MKNTISKDCILASEVLAIASRYSHLISLVSAGTTQWASKEVSTRNVVEISVVDMSLYRATFDQYHENMWNDLRNPTCESTPQHSDAVKVLAPDDFDELKRQHRIIRGSSQGWLPGSARSLSEECKTLSSIQDPRKGPGMSFASGLTVRIGCQGSRSIIRVPGPKLSLSHLSEGPSRFLSAGPRDRGPSMSLFAGTRGESP